MSPRGWEFRIQDIIGAINRILKLTQGKRFEDFADEETIVEAVLWNFMIMGEAAANLPAEIYQKHPDIPWRDMRDQRNFVAHEYYEISLRILWKTITDDLPPLIPQLENLLKES